MRIEQEFYKKSGKKLLRYSVYWLIAALFLFVPLLFSQELNRAISITVLVILPLIPPVHINYYLIDKFFLKRQYVNYFMFGALLVIVFGIVAQLLIRIEFDGTNDFFAAMLNPLFIVIVTSGFKGYIEHLQNKYTIQEARLKQAEAESNQARAELELLKAQVNPHFLFNTLNSIYSLSLDASEMTPKAVMLLSKLMRYQLDSSKLPLVSVQNEFDFINSYIELEKLRLGKKCVVDLVSEGINDQQQIAPMLLIPAVENCFKHGISANQTQNYIFIKLNLNGNLLSLETKNNIAPKADDFQNGRKTKMGIENLKRRLELIYQGKHGLQISTENNEYKLSLKIEL